MTCKTKRSLTTSRGRRTTSMLCLWWTRSESRSNNHLGPWCPPLQLDTVLLWCWFQRGRNNLGSSLFAKLRLTVLGSLRHYNVHEPYVSRIVTRSKQKRNLKISLRQVGCPSINWSHSLSSLLAHFLLRERKTAVCNCDWFAFQFNLLLRKSLHHKGADKVRAKRMTS